MKNFFDDLENSPPESHEQYLKNLPRYKEFIDKTPNKFLNFHLNDAIKNERYELAAYIKKTAEKRNFKLITTH
jgi:hypothetical protein